MNLKELVDLISIRQYVRYALEFPTIDKSTVSEMNGTLILIDKKIIEILKSSDFKEYIDYKDVSKAIQDVASITNIRSGLKK